MDFEEFKQKTDDIVAQSRATEDPAAKEKLRDDFFDVAIDYFNEHLTGDMKLADGRTLFMPAIENPK